MSFDKEFGALLKCPQCNGPIRLVDDESAFACEACRLLFAIDDGIPNFLIEQAKPLKS